MAPYNPVAWRVHFEGIVQHVHFRASIRRIAAELGIHGWVQNDMSGCSVVAHLEGVHVHTLIESVLFENALSDTMPFTSQIYVDQYKGSDAIPFISQIYVAKYEGFSTFTILPTF